MVQPVRVEVKNEDAQGNMIDPAGEKAIFRG